MKKRSFSVFAALILLAGCTGQPVSSSSENSVQENSEVSELPDDPAVLGTVYGKEVPYTDYRLYLDLNDVGYQQQLRQEMAFTYFLETKMKEKNILFDEAAFETYAAEQYYTEMLSQPRLIDEIEAAASATGLMVDGMNLALFEGYRQSYDIMRLGDFYAEEYVSDTPLSEELDEQKREEESIQYANEKLSVLLEEFNSTAEFPEDGNTDILCTIGEKEIPLEDRHKAYTVLAIARARISLVDAILIGKGMAHEMEQAGFEPDIFEFETQLNEYLEKLKSDETFFAAYDDFLKKQDRTLSQALESMRCTTMIMAAMEQPYYDFISEQYENLPEDEKSTYTLDEYYTQRCEALYGECIPVNPLG